MAGIEGSVAIVTGSGQGIGRAIALRLANDGADVAVPDVNLEKAQSVADEITALDTIVVAVERRRQTMKFSEGFAWVGPAASPRHRGAIWTA